MTDLYLPEIALHIEVDEDFHRSQIDADRTREADIVDATSHTICRVDARLSLEDLNKQVDRIIDDIQNALASAIGAGTFTPWDPETEYSAATHIERGYIDSREDVAFHRQFDALNCFGYSYTSEHHPSGGGGVTHPHEPNTMIWFPRLYDAGVWKNAITQDEATIEERRATDNDAFVAQSLAQPRKFERLVFARVKDSLGTLFRFRGRYRIDPAASNEASAIVHRRIGTRAKTYTP